MISDLLKQIQPHLPTEFPFGISGGTAAFRRSYNRQSFTVPAAGVPPALSPINGCEHTLDGLLWVASQKKWEKWKSQKSGARDPQSAVNQQNDPEIKAQPDAASARGKKLLIKDRGEDADPAAGTGQEILNFPGFQRCHSSGSSAHRGVSPADKGMRAQP